MNKTTDVDSGKRKASQEQPEGLKDPKQRKKNSQVLSANRNTSNTIEKLVSFWTAGGNVHPLLTQEGTDNMKLKEAEDKFREADKIVNDLQKKLVASAGNVTNLQIALKQEETEKETLVQKMNSTWELIRTITQHVTYATDTLHECQKHTTYLTTTYNDVILKLRGDNEVLNKKLTSIASDRNANAENALKKLAIRETEIEELKAKCEMIECHLLSQKELAQNAINDTEKYKKKIYELENSEELLKQKVQDLEIKILNEQNKVESICASQKQKWSQTRHNYESELSALKAELEETRCTISNVRGEREEVFHILAEKEKEIDSLEKKNKTYSKKIEELQSNMNDTCSNLELFNNQKSIWEAQLKEKNDEICKLIKDLNSATAEKTELQNQMTKLNEKFKNQAEEKLNLQTTLSQNSNLLNESSKRVEELTKSLEENEKLKKQTENALTQKETIIMELERKLSRLEVQHEEQLHKETVKYEKCMNELKKLKSTLKTSEKTDTTIRTENEKLKEKVEEYEEILKKERYDMAELIKELKNLRSECDSYKIIEKENNVTVNKTNELQRKVNDMMNLLTEDKIKTRSSVKIPSSPNPSIKNTQNKTSSPSRVFLSEVKKNSQEVQEKKYKKNAEVTKNRSAASKPKVVSVETVTTKPILRSYKNSKSPKSPKKASVTWKTPKEDKSIALNDSEDEFDKIVTSVNMELPNSQMGTPGRKFFKNRLSQH
ncbi:uncharacterized protein PFB0765w-like [Aphidius gifuensis]|uniref:uncharacterized protein PFB0765w-like n=1 Tax=Aphidius gifuensis TaxID=684658 RepID=UPI001CDB7DD7|nr:uncharacterized protein PFB0765w-like [Aphidius gifuensis]